MTSEISQQNVLSFALRSGKRYKRDQGEAKASAVVADDENKYAECLVCYERFDKSVFPGLKNPNCGHWHCCVCEEKLWGLCSICDREEINMHRHCDNCGKCIELSEQLACLNDCGRLYCVHCSDPLECCFWDNVPFCHHTDCPDCPIAPEDSEEEGEGVWWKRRCKCCKRRLG